MSVYSTSSKQSELESQLRGMMQQVIDESGPYDWTEKWIKVVVERIASLENELAAAKEQISVRDQFEHEVFEASDGNRSIRMDDDSARQAASRAYWSKHQEIEAYKRTQDELVDELFQANTTIKAVKDFILLNRVHEITHSYSHAGLGCELCDILDIIEPE